MNGGKTTLLNKLRGTLLVVSASMLLLWALFYLNMQSKIQNYAMSNMEQVSNHIIAELNNGFLELEELAFEMSDNEMVYDFFKAESSIDFYRKAMEVDKILAGLHDEAGFGKNVILIDRGKRFYRFRGTINNTGTNRIIKIIEGEKGKRHIQLVLNGVKYIGYVDTIYEDQTLLGSIVMLTSENDLVQLFNRLEGNDNMKIALAADHVILVSNEEELIDQGTDTFLETTDYFARQQIGFTPFELLVSYQDTNQDIKMYYFGITVIMAILLLLLLETFVHFWRKEFFAPIQSVINAVEQFEGSEGELLPMPGQEHFNGLVNGINAMTKRIEALQDAEIKKQRALIVSLKKQISAHFTVNVLNSIKVISAAGEKEKAGRLCDGLSFLYRYANDGEHFIPLIEEFFILNKYAEIMEIRHPDKFKVEIEMDEGIEEICIPRMLLQPIVENSIMHGFIEKDRSNQGKIHIYTMSDEEVVRIIIADNGIGIEAKQLQKLKQLIESVSEENDVEVEGISNIAILNIQRRIQSYFGNDYQLEIGSEVGKGTRVILTLPCTKIVAV